MRKVDLEPRSGKSPGHVAIGESLIWLNNERFWLFAAVDSETKQFSHVCVFQGRVLAQTEHFVSELLEKYELEETLFLVDGTPWSHSALNRHGCGFGWETHGGQNTVECVFKGLKRSLYQFENTSRMTLSNPPNRRSRCSL